MSADQFKEKTDEIVAVMNRLPTKVAGTSNAVEYNRFLTKTLEKAQTFDVKNKAAYKDYGLEAIEKQNKPQKKSGGEENKKRKTDTENDDEDKAKSAKKAKKPDAGGRDKPKKAKKPAGSDEL